MGTNKKTQKKTLSKNGLLFHILLAIGLSVVIFFLTVLLLRFFTRHGREVEMPDFKGRSADELIQKGTSEGFVFVVNDEIYERNAEPGTVLKQNPLPGEKVKNGRKVYLTLAASQPPMVKMPELRDLSLRQAQIMLESQKLVLDKVIEKPSPYENVVLEVLYNGHTVSAGKEVRQGDKITLVVGKNIGDLPEEAEEGQTEEIQ
ncbi:MAG: PASTA domain-containing protein [Bacteroidales bacterium]|nr:PASTA domain-containing protein [Bacteroidales bacterium]MDY6348411.1 PASTA domain-containing protein [Bacteroidales bacterium]